MFALPAIANQNTQLEIILDLRADDLTDSGPLNQSFSGGVISTSIKKYGSGSFDFVSPGDIQVPNNAQLTSFDNITIEFWWYPTTVTTTQGLFQFNGYQTAGITGAFLVWVGSSSVFRVGTNADIPATLSENTWHHIVVMTKNNRDSIIYLNGVHIGTTERALSSVFTPNNTAFLGIGQQGFNGNSGYIDSFRITKGRKYTANFDPETDTGLAPPPEVLLSENDLELLSEDNVTLIGE